MNNAKWQYVGNEAKRQNDTFCQSVQITLSGPQGTPYEEGTFFLLFHLPSNYPKGS